MRDERRTARYTHKTLAIRKKMNPLKGEERTYFGLWLEPIYESTPTGYSQTLTALSQNCRPCFGRALCTFLPSRCSFSPCTAPMSTKTARRNNTGGLTSDVPTLPLFREYTFQSTRTNVAHATVVAEFAVPIWSVVGVSANHLGSGGTPTSRVSGARVLLRHPTKTGQPFRSEDVMVSNRHPGPPLQPDK